jgi:TldD protein
MQRRHFLPLLPALGLAPAAAAQMSPSADPIIRAMQEEMARSRPLGVAGNEPIYYLECTLDEVKSFSASAVNGALLNSRSNAFRIPKVSLRVGDMKFDNTNYLLTELFQGTRYDPDQFPLDNNHDAMRQVLWLAIDRAYKTAIEAIGRKRAALKNVTQAEVLPDFSAAPAFKALTPIPPFNVNEDAWKSRIIRLSRVFNEFPEVFSSNVELDFSWDTNYFANTEGSEVRQTEILAYVRVRAVSQAPDGMRVRDHYNPLALDLNSLPGEEALAKEIRKVGANVQALVKAPVSDNYSGPVLFEAEASAQLFADLIGSQAGSFRKPVAEPGRNVPVAPGELDGRIGSRILPSSFTVVDDPTQKAYKGRPLIGHYTADLEAVAPKPVVLIEKGSFKGYLSTRLPTKDSASSNGHARLPGNFGANTAFMSNLFVKSDEALPPAELKQKFIDLIKQRNKPFGLLVRKLDFPSTASIDELRQMLGGSTSRPAPLPLLVFRVYPDGREELVRGLRFRGLNTRALKDILQAGNDEAHFDFIGNLAPFSLTGGGNYIVGCSVVAPSILFEDLELERPQVELPKLPIVPPPPLTA